MIKNRTRAKQIILKVIITQKRKRASKLQTLKSKHYTDTLSVEQTANEGYFESCENHSTQLKEYSDTTSKQNLIPFKLHKEHLCRELYTEEADEQS